LLQRIEPNTLSTVQKAILEESERLLLFQDGKESANEFLQTNKQS